MTAPSLWTCGQCRMGFAVVDEHRGNGEMLRCPEAPCDLRFRCAVGSQTASVSVTAADLDQHQRWRSA